MEESVYRKMLAPMSFLLAQLVGVAHYVVRGLRIMLVFPILGALACMGWALTLRKQIKAGHVS